MTATQSTTEQGPPPVNPTRRSGNPILRFWRSAVGKKWIMAVSGIMLLGFVLFHMLGNLKIYLGAVHLDEYADWLRTLGPGRHDRVPAVSSMACDVEQEARERL